MKPPPCVVDRWQLNTKTAKVLLLSPGQGNLVNTDVFAQVFLLYVIEKTFQILDLF